MPSASANFTVGSSQVQQQQPSIAPAVGGVINTNSSLNYPTYVPVTVPAPVPSKEAAITNVNMPTTVLPGSAFSIIVTVTTYIAGVASYYVTLDIPQLQLHQQSPPMQLSNNATGATTFQVSLPGTAIGLTAAGTITGQLSLLGGASGGTVDAVPISFTIGGTAIRSPIGVVPAPIQNIPVGPVGVPVLGAVPVGPGAIRVGYYGRRYY